MKGNKTALVLMVVSMVLLTAFQAFWLRKEYLGQEANLYKESDLLFKQTIRTMEDAMVRGKIDKAMQLGPPGSRPPLRPRSRDRVMIMMNDKERGQALKRKGSFQFKDSSNHRTIVLVRNDSASRMRVTGLKGDLKTLNLPPDSIKNVVFRKRPDSLGGFSVMITMNSVPGAGKDSLDQLARMMNPVRAAMLEERLAGGGKIDVPGNRMIYLDLTADTISLNSLRVNFKKQLAKSGKPLKIVVKRDTNGLRKPVFSRSVLTSNTEGPGYHYTARFPESKAYLFSKIRTQILFSVVLLAITGLAFGSIYRSHRQQSRLSEIKNDLISNITHELKTPLSTVSVALEALQNFAGTNKPELTREYLEISRNEVDRLSLMVDNILKNSMLEHQSVPLQMEELDVKELTQQLTQVWQPRFEKQGARLLLASEGRDFVLNADRIHLGSVIHNLIDNALKYGGESAEVKVTLKEKNETIEIQVEDNGPGIPKEYRDQIFEKFFRVPTGDKHTVKGYGLGLNYVWNIVKQHGGSVRLENSPEKGSVFIVTLKKKV